MKDVSAGLKGDSSGSKLASPVAGASVSSVGFRSPIESYGRNPVRGNDDFQTIGGTHFMIQPYGNHVSPTQAADWRGSLDTRSSAGYDMTGMFSPESLCGYDGGVKKLISDVLSMQEEQVAEGINLQKTETMTKLQTRDLLLGYEKYRLFP